MNVFSQQYFIPKKSIVLSSLVSMLICLNAPICYSEPPHLEQTAMQLESSFLQFVDGQPFGITPHIFGYLLQLRIGLKQFFYGAANIEKMVIHRNTKYTLKEMAVLEIKEEKSFKEHTARRTYYDNQTWRAIEQEHTEQSNAFQESLDHAKTALVEYLSPFLYNIQPIKKQLLPLILESCEKRGRAESMLPNCIGMPDGKEIAHFQQVMTSYKQLGLFCLDLIHFLTDMIYSCPKARAQFEQLRKIDTVTQSIIDSTAN